MCSTIWLLTNCASLQTIDGVTAVARGETIVGTLCLCDFHIIFRAPPPKDHNAPPGAQPRAREMWLAYPMLSHCEFRPSPPGSGRDSTIRYRGRDFYYITLNIPDHKAAQEAFNLIKARTCQLGSIDKLYAFNYKPVAKERQIKGWELYDIKEEFRRQGISEKQQDRGWRISSINKDYSFSPTYPSVLVVPNRISDSTLRYAGKHRTRYRVPTLTYLHPVNNCAITRSSQPRVGLTNNRNAQDEALVAACFSNPYFQEASSVLGVETGPYNSQNEIAEKSDSDAADSDRTEQPELLSAGDAFSDEKGKRLIFGAQQHNLIIDARPAINSMAMQVVGKGSENMNYYKFATKAYLNIQNIHVMRNSLNKVINALKDGDISSGPPNQDLLAKSDWLKHISDILEGSSLIAKQVGINHSHVLIHCSDGWDRTSQLSALSQIMLDPYYRTLDGFIVLVEKDWLSFGHMFHQRSGFLNHEKWFEVQNDAMAGVRIEPGDNEGPGEVIENAMENAKRFFRQALSSDKEREDSDPDNLNPAIAGAAEQESSPVIEDQATRPKETSPVFHQFLDAVYQLQRQNPKRFEFNERFLRRLLYHLYSCQYGTFLLNNEKQRIDAKLREKTTSVWNYFLSRKEMFLNPDYDPTVNDLVRGQERLIFPELNEIRWWYQLFGRTDKEMNSNLDAAAALEKKVQSAAASPRRGNSPPMSHPESPRPHTDVQQSEPGAKLFGSTVLAGLEFPQNAGSHSGDKTGGSSIATITKGLSDIGFGGFGELGKNLVAHSSTSAREQEMTSMGAVKNVAP